MNLDRVTITGADDSVEPSDLLALSREHPFVEWGLLVSASNTGTPRFPSYRWLLSLVEQCIVAAVNYREPRLSLHFCGRWVRGLLLGQQPEGMPHWFTGPQFQRMQLNFHGETLPCVPEAFGKALGDFQDKQIIFQIDGHMGQSFLASVADERGNPFDAVPLFDCSHGAGVLPGTWPAPFCPKTYHGYAGGLGPDNLAEQLPLIGAAAGETRIWIDMESRVRTDERFDLAKVRRCLEICKPFVRVEAMA